MNFLLGKHQKLSSYSHNYYSQQDLKAFSGVWGLLRKDIVERDIHKDLVVDQYNLIPTTTSKALTELIALLALATTSLQKNTEQEQQSPLPPPHIDYNPKSSVLQATVIVAMEMQPYWQDKDHHQQQQ